MAAAPQEPHGGLLEANIRMAYVFYETVPSINVMYTVNDPN
jgi:hypothetical protein